MSTTTAETRFDHRGFITELLTTIYAESISSFCNGRNNRIKEQKVRSIRVGESGVNVVLYMECALRASCGVKQCRFRESIWSGCGNKSAVGGIMAGLDSGQDPPHALFTTTVDILVKRLKETGVRNSGVVVVPRSSSSKRAPLVRTRDRRLSGAVLYQPLQKCLRKSSHSLLVSTLHRREKGRVFTASRKFRKHNMDGADWSVTTRL